VRRERAYDVVAMDDEASRVKPSDGPRALPDVQSLNYVVRPRDERLGDGQAERSRGLQIDDEFESRRLLDRQVTRSCSLENPVHVPGGHDIVFGNERAIADQAAVFDKGDIAACR